jgi:hypothetical protein
MAVTLATLRTRVRQQADQESSTFISDSELTAYINQSARDLHGLLSTTYEDYFLTSVQFTLSTANTYTLPTNFLKLRGLDYSNADDWVTVPRFAFEDRNKYQQRYQRGDLDVWRMYRIMQGAIYIVPEDDYAGTYRLWYTYDFTELSSDSDTLANTLGWDEYVVVDAAIKCLQKEESDASLLMARKADLKQRIMAEAANRDASGPERITVVGSLDDYAVDLDSWNR